MTKRALITGGAGFIGSHLADELLASGFQVRVVDSLEPQVHGPERRSVVKLPEALDDMDVPGEPLGCVMNIRRRSQISSGQRVAVVGVGFLGALLIGLASKAGAEVVAVKGPPT